MCQPTLSLTYLAIVQAPSALNCSSTLCQRWPDWEQGTGVRKDIEQMSQQYTVTVCGILTISAVWFLLRTALWRAVMPSFVLKSRCAPPLFSTLMSSAQPSSCAASVNGHSAGSKDNEAKINLSVFPVTWLRILFRNLKSNNWRCQYFNRKCEFAATLHLDNCLGCYDCNTV